MYKFFDTLANWIEDSFGLIVVALLWFMENIFTFLILAFIIGVSFKVGWLAW